MPKCESNSVKVNNTYKKIASTLLNLFTEFNTQNQSLVLALNGFSTNINGKKEEIISVLDEYIQKRSDCCFNIGLKLDSIILLFSEIPCIIPNQPEVTTTVEPTTTGVEPTTTLDPLLCYETTISGKGVYYPQTTVVYLGTGTGLVTIQFTANDIPNRLEVIFDGNTVIDTGYIGNSVFQPYLDAVVYDEGDVAGDITNITSATLYFNKDSATTTATVNVYSPLENSSFEVVVSCPDDGAQCQDITLDILDIEYDSTTTVEPTTTAAPEQFLITNIIGYSSGSVSDACSNPPESICIYGSTTSLATTTFLHDVLGNDAPAGNYLYVGHFRYWDGSAFVVGGTYVCGNDPILCEPTTTLGD